MIRSWLPQRLSFRRLALLFVAASILPPLLAGGFLLIRLVGQQRTTDEQRLQQTAVTQAIGIEQEFAGSIRALRTLAASEPLATGNLKGFDEEARRVVATQPSWYAIILATDDGRQIVNTARPYAEPSRKVVERASLERAVRTLEPVVGPLTRGPEGRIAFPVRLPIHFDESVLVLTAVVTPDTLLRSIERHLVTTGEWQYSIADQAGIIALRAKATNLVGQSLPREMLDQMNGTSQGLARFTALDGGPVYAAYSRVQPFGWTSIVMAPVDTFDGPYRWGIYGLVGFGLVALTLTSAGAWVFAHRMSSRLDATREAAERLARGEVPSTAPTLIAEMAALGEALERSAALLAERRRERDEQLASAEAARETAEQAKAAADKAARAKDEFLAMLGHELRNPLSPIVMALHLLKMRPIAWDREHAVIERQVVHLTRLVDDLLDVSRITRGKVELRRERIEMREVVEQALEMAGHLLEERRHHLKVSVPAQNCQVDGDRARLAQVTANLLVNAAKYTPPGGRIWVTAQCEADNVILSIRDDGQGLSPELLPRIFDLFVQGHRTVDRQQGGLGLGLSIVQQLVRLHGGSVSAHSEGLGRGSTFTIVLPAAAAVEVTPERETPHDEPRASRLKVLVVDDSRDAADMLSSWLRHDGHEVVTAYDSLLALEVAWSLRPDVAILDIGLPVVDGYELAANLRRQLGVHAPILIAATGYGQEHDRLRSEREGFVAHLVKPIDLDELTALLSTIVPLDPAPAEPSKHA